MRRYIFIYEYALWFSNLFIETVQNDLRPNNDNNLKIKKKLKLLMTPLF